MEKNNNSEVFEDNLFKGIFQDAILEKYAENQTAFSKLVGSDESYYNFTSQRFIQVV